MSRAKRDQKSRVDTEKNNIDYYTIRLRQEMAWREKQEVSEQEFEADEILRLPECLVTYLDSEKDSI